MQTQLNGNAVLDKTRELCQTILADPKMGSIRSRIDTFMADASARSQYETVVSKGQALHEKQEQSLPLTPEEIGEFESNRETLLKNPVARGFLDAREELHELQHTIQKLVSKTLELGRMPTKDDLEEGESCGHGCGCHGH
ncbi:MAG TPA: YlbF family regulator [Verrucomicrobiota bacterium]|nr:YlbF family regulator [Verrucomicrobiota bacterium]